MNIDEIVTRLTKPTRNAYLDYLMALNPTLIHFFYFFTENNNNQSREWFMELTENFFHKIRGRNSAPKKCKQLILSGAINLIRRKKHTDLLERCNELIYEEVLLEPLPKRFFSKEYIPSIQDLERFRSQQLSTPMCLILDLVFQEKLEIPEIAKILKLSENVFEPFLFTVVHRLVGETNINNQNQLEFFSTVLHSSENPDNASEFANQLCSLKSFLSLDIRNRLDQSILLSLCNKYFPATEDEKIAETTNFGSKSTSFIDQIKKRNQDLKLEDAAKQFSKSEVKNTTEIEVYNPERSVNTNSFHYAKYALGILTIFIGMVFYRTIFEQKNTHNPVAIDNLKSTSISSLQANLNQTIGILSNLENEFTVTKLQWIIQKNNEAYLTLKPNIDIQIAENTKLQIRSNKELFLKFGSIRVNTKNSEIKIYTKDGVVTIGSKENIKSSAHIAKPNRNYSIAGNLEGELIVQIESDQKIINLDIGQQIIFGDTKLEKLSSYSSAYFQPTVDSTQISSRQLRFPSTQTRRSSLSNTELKNILLSVEKVIKKPSVKQKDFSQKL